MKSASRVKEIKISELIVNSPQAVCPASGSRDPPHNWLQSASSPTAGLILFPTQSEQVHHSCSTQHYKLKHVFLTIAVTVK